MNRIKLYLTRLPSSSEDDFHEGRPTIVIIVLYTQNKNDQINRLIMIIALSEVQFGLKWHICNHKFDFRPILHDTKCNFHFIVWVKYLLCEWSVYFHWVKYSLVWNDTFVITNLISDQYCTTRSAISTLLCCGAQAKSLASLYIRCVSLLLC